MADTPPTHMVRIDYTNGSALILDPDRQIIAAYGSGITRHTLAQHINPDGWFLPPPEEQDWKTTTPPDGREHPVYYRGPDKKPATTEEPAQYQRIRRELHPSTH